MQGTTVRLLPQTRRNYTFLWQPDAARILWHLKVFFFFFFFFFFFYKQLNLQNFIRVETFSFHENWIRCSFYPWKCFFPEGIILSCVCDYPPGKKFFRRILFWAVSVIMFYYPPGKEFFWKILFQSRLGFCFIIRRKRIFSKDIVFSRVCDFFGFFSCLFVDTITLERLNQSEPKFHTWLLTLIARPSSKMGIAGYM